MYVLNPPAGGFLYLPLFYTPPTPRRVFSGWGGGCMKFAPPPPGKRTHTLRPFHPPRGGLGPEGPKNSSGGMEGSQHIQEKRFGINLWANAFREGRTWAIAIRRGVERALAGGIGPAGMAL